MNLNDGRTHTNERGLTLIEVLATVVILTIISFFVFNIIVSSQKQQVEQQEDTKNLYDLTYALKLITKDFRMSTSFDETSNTFYKSSSTIKVASYTYDSTSKQLLRDVYNEAGQKIYSSTISENISSFAITKDPVTNALIVDLSNNTNQTIKNTLYYRE